MSRCRCFEKGSVCFACFHLQTAGVGEMMKDTIMLCGHEAYIQALYYYGSVKLAARTGDAEAKTIADDLGKRFPRGKKF